MVIEDSSVISRSGKTCLIRLSVGTGDSVMGNNMGKVKKCGSLSSSMNQVIDVLLVEQPVRQKAKRGSG